LIESVTGHNGKLFGSKLRMKASSIQPSQKIVDDIVVSTVCEDFVAIDIPSLEAVPRGRL
jgi:hypothetical protein